MLIPQILSVYGTHLILSCLCNSFSLSAPISTASFRQFATRDLSIHTDEGFSFSPAVVGWCDAAGYNSNLRASY